MLDVSSLLVPTELAIESWLLLLSAGHRIDGRSRDVVESKLPAGESVLFARTRAGEAL